MINRPTKQCCSLVGLAMLLAIAGCRDSSSTPQTYTLSATVSGLTGSGLVVTANGTDVSVPPSATTQRLAASLADGTNYSVTIKSQPSGQTCSIAGGSGTIHAANAANVVVTCSNQAYALGGSITGLSTSGLVLANGSDTVSVISGATTFLLPAQVAFSSSYQVTVQTQPSGQTCAVSAGSGSMPAAAVNTVAVSCTDQPFTLAGTVSDSPGVTLSNGGDTVMVPSAPGISHFTMGQSVPYGSTYNLTVSNVPAGHTCTVNNGSGTMGAANVTDLTVTCATNAYTIGGSLSGLVSGDTLILLNTNGDHTTVDPTRSSYMMTQSVAYGSSYGITVATQPSGKNCTVANSSSPNITGNISNVNVTCSVVTHTVGGTISGLGAATGLVLEDNGGDGTIINANATAFTMTTGVAAGSPYAITIQTQPTAASVANATATVNCTLTGDSGTVGGSDITSVVITCHNTVSFLTAGGPYTWTIPAGVSSIDIVAIGGGGGGGGSNSGSTGTNLPSKGGRGGMVSATLGVNVGDQMSLFVGGGGGGGAQTLSAFGAGGGGGGSSNVNPGTANQIIAGGGGGGSGQNSFGDGGDGNGGDGAGLTGGKGGSGGVGGAGGSDGFPFDPHGGDGGSGNGGPGAAGGSNGNGSIAGGTAGVGSGAGAGGETDSQLFNYSSVGGGGAGGYGGGGGSATGGGGGGGGSTGPTGSVIGVSTASTGPGSAGAGGAVGEHPGTAGGDGSIVISY